MKHHRHSKVIIDLAAIRSNYQYLKSLSPESRLIAVVKADAYGHGALEVAQTLAPIADAFAVATSEEALQIRKAGIEQKILVMGGVVSADELQDCVDYQLDPVFHQDWQIALLSAISDSSQLEIWLKYNSGMGRLGFDVAGLEQALRKTRAMECVSQIRLMTHFASADDVNDPKTGQQLQQVEELQLGSMEWGMANSAGLLGWPKARVTWVRSGIALYGSDPLLNQAQQNQLQPAMTFESEVLALNELKAGSTVGYGATYTCQQDSRIAVVAAGYADGYPRHAQNTEVMIRGQRFPVVGRVSMDMITVDVTGSAVSAGDPVELWGQKVIANEVAERSETISYELFCHAGCHATRQFTGI